MVQCCETWTSFRSSLSKFGFQKHASLKWWFAKNQHFKVLGSFVDRKGALMYVCATVVQNILRIIFKCHTLDGITTLRGLIIVRNANVGWLPYELSEGQRGLCKRPKFSFYFFHFFKKLKIIIWIYGPKRRLYIYIYIIVLHNMFAWFIRTFYHNIIIQNSHLMPDIIQLIFSKREPTAEVLCYHKAIIYYKSDSCPANFLSLNFACSLLLRNIRNLIKSAEDQKWLYYEKFFTQPYTLMIYTHFNVAQ